MPLIAEANLNELTGGIVSLQNMPAAYYRYKMAKSVRKLAFATCNSQAY
jgi:hypothetical protein